MVRLESVILALLEECTNQGHHLLAKDTPLTATLLHPSRDSSQRACVLTFLVSQEYTHSFMSSFCRHVVTRWYRAPELILQIKEYTAGEPETVIICVVLVSDSIESTQTTASSSSDAHVFTQQLTCGHLVASWPSCSTWCTNPTITKESRSSREVRVTRKLSVRKSTTRAMRIHTIS